MAKRKRRVPRYQRDEFLREREVERAAALPPVTIVADLSQQAPNNSYSARLFYQDYEFNCVDCGRAQIWTAAQQKWWYEVAKGSIYSGAKRCRECRTALRAANGCPPRRSPQDRDQDLH